MSLTVELRHGEEVLQVTLALEGEHVRGTVSGRPVEVERLPSGAPTYATAGALVQEVTLATDGRTRRAIVAKQRDRVLVALEGRVYAFATGDAARDAVGAGGGTGKIVAPMPGKVIAVLVEVGARVAHGDPVVVIEATTFAVPFLLRGFDVSLAEAAAAYGLIVGIAACIGVFLGGWLADRMGAVDRRAYVVIPAVGALLSTPLYVAVFLQTSLMTMAWLIVAPAIVHYLYMGPTFGLTANMVDARMRAAASSIVLLLMNLVGVGLGPIVAGLLSDIFAGQAFLAGDYATLCPGGRAAADASAAIVAECRSASFLGLRDSMIVTSAAYVWAAVHFFLAARSVSRDVPS